MVTHIQTIINLLWNNWNFTPAAPCNPDTRKQNLGLFRNIAKN